MAVSYATCERVALEDDSAIWELVCGRLREKQGMTQDHNDRAMELVAQLIEQLDRRRFRIRTNSAALRITEATYFVPDVAVIPVDLPPAGARDTSLEMYEQPVPLVVEVWSPSTGTKDFETKVPEYQSRGDFEIWRIHPREREVTVWRRQPDGSYRESRHTAGVVPIESLPNVSIDLGRLFA
jgi:Uma2 family endonuclease